MSEYPNIADAEWLVMKVIWAHSECSANQIIQELSGTTEWKPKTVKSLISRLLKKKAICFKEDKRAYIYYPLVTEEECIRVESQSFLNRVFGGEVNTAIAKFIEDKNMSKQQIDELRKMLDDKDER
ncbi:MAG: BlaI/MecI/CopY family transcriptional regulator [Bacteroidota bacterium]|nr:BlaI/MecI/CopY family transcriptional regulator [Bacteroidota bacterium]